MGIDFSHCGAHWSYSGFHRARTRLAAVIGINLNDMQGFQMSSVAGMANHPAISWGTVNDDITALLYHSDCDGELTPEECQKIAPRLRELVKNWPDDDYDKKNFLELADGMDAAAKDKEPLQFT